MNKVESKIVGLEAVKQVISDIEDHIKWLSKSYTTLDTMVPKKAWDSESRTYKTVMDEDGNEVMENEWGYVDKKEDDYSEEDLVKLETYRDILSCIEEKFL